MLELGGERGYRFLAPIPWLELFFEASRDEVLRFADSVAFQNKLDSRLPSLAATPISATEAISY